MAWFDGVADGTASFCRYTQQGFLRLANNPSVFPEAITADAAWGLFDVMLSDPRVVMAPEPAGIEPLWRRATAGRPFTPKLWNDAFLTAFAAAGGYELVTFDQGLASNAPGSVRLLA